MEILDLVRNIGEKICEDEITTMVTILKESGLVVENFPRTSGVEFLSEMVSKNMITTCDLRLLEKILYVLERKELIEYLMEFKCQQDYYVPDEQSDDRSTGSVTFIFKNSRPTGPLLRGLIIYLSELLSIPRENVSLRHVDSVGEEGALTFIIKQAYVEILESLLKDDRHATALNAFGVIEVHTRTNKNISFHTYELIVPTKQLQDHEEVFTMMDQRNAEFANELDRFAQNIEPAMQMITEAGDISTHMDNLKRLHQSSGMSTTIWKTLGKMKEEHLPEYYTPNMMQDEIRQACLYSKGRLARLYPGRSWGSSKTANVI